MIERPHYLKQLKKATRRSPVTALLGPRQIGKTTLARFFVEGSIAQDQITFFDLESPPDQRRLQNPEMVLGSLSGLVVIDEVQVMPQLFNILRVLVDRSQNQAHFLILGSASPYVVKNVSETLAGRVEFIDLNGFDLSEVGSANWKKLWIRGGFPRSFLAESVDDSMAWRDGFVRTFLERDIPQLGINVPSAAMRRFWIMLAHYHGQLWNASTLGRSMGLSDKTVRSYLDILTSTFMLRQLQPWHINISKRQVKSPKVYFRDPGLLHYLLDLPNMHSLLAHPQIGSSWEGFLLEQVLQVVKPNQAYFWAMYSGAELDLFFIHQGRHFGIEITFNESPRITRSMRTARDDLGLDHLWLIYPGEHRYPVDDRITVYPLVAVPNLLDQMQ